MHKKLLFAIIAAIAATNAYSDQVLTSRAYVDDGLATKQDKITAGTTGAVVTYNGIQDGQTQFTERAIYDGSATYDSTTDANKLITAGAVNTMTPSLPTGTANAAVTYDANGNIGGEREIFGTNYTAIWARPTVTTNDDKLAKVGDVRMLQNLITDASKRGSAPSDENDYRMLPVFNSALNGKFGGLITANSLDEGTWKTNNWSTNNVIPSLMAVNAGMESKQNKMTCTRWLDTPEHPEHTDENCLLWELGN